MQSSPSSHRSDNHVSLFGPSELKMLSIAVKVSYSPSLDAVYNWQDVHALLFNMICGYHRIEDVVVVNFHTPILHMDTFGLYSGIPSS